MICITQIVRYGASITQEKSKQVNLFILKKNVSFFMTCILENKMKKFKKHPYGVTLKQ